MAISPPILIATSLLDLTAMSIPPPTVMTIQTCLLTLTLTIIRTSMITRTRKSRSSLHSTSQTSNYRHGPQVTSQQINTARLSTSDVLTQNVLMSFHLLCQSTRGIYIWSHQSVANFSTTMVSSLVSSNVADHPWMNGNASSTITQSLALCWAYPSLPNRTHVLEALLLSPKTTVTVTAITSTDQSLMQSCTGSRNMVAKDSISLSSSTV